ncbi:hypothetical protein SEEM054_22252 [Salmonella enterica subsp. enterica serovar Montevideo str. NC_MB110209-0054]|nr:hypothetical protein SEEM054_22252 [Salmonella enterica subsp. enterica serovar Montevideo str. NC_MB110209-0054]
MYEIHPVKMKCPRASGDKPMIREGVATHALCSPRQRG